MKRRITILAWAVALALVLSCLTSRSSSAQQSTPIASACAADAACFVFTHAFAAGPAKVDLYVDSKLTASNVALSDSSALISVSGGAHWLQLPAAGSAPSAAQITASVTFKAGTVSDLVLRDADGAARLSLYQADPTAPAPGLSRVRVINLWPGIGAVDVNLGDPGDKTGLDPDATIAGVKQNSASGYAELGQFSDQAAVSVFAAGTADLKAAPALRPCPADGVCSYILIGPAGKDKPAIYALAVFLG
jgi:hypothetical protein